MIPSLEYEKIAYDVLDKLWNIDKVFELKFDISFLGYQEIKGTNHFTFNETCEQCKPGTYGAVSDRSSCEKCRAGVICLTGKGLPN